MALFDNPSAETGRTEVAVVAGVPIYLSRELLWSAIAFVAVGIALSMIDPRLSRAPAITIATVIVMTLSTLLHECGHAIAARRAGVAVERIELRGVSGATILSHPPDRPGPAALVAAAGPALTALLALAGAMLLNWTSHEGTSATSMALAEGSTGQVIAAIVFIINAVTLIANLLPGLPLDGGYLLRAALWQRSGSAARSMVWPARLGLAIGIAACGLGPVIASSDPIGGLLVVGFGIAQIIRARPHFALAQTIAHIGNAPVAAAIAPKQLTLCEDTTREQAAEDFQQLSHITSAHLPVISTSGKYLGLLHRSALTRPHDSGMTIAGLVTPAEREPDVGIVRVGERLIDHLATGPLTRNGALIAVDIHDRFQGIMYMSSVTRALECHRDKTASPITRP